MSDDSHWLDALLNVQRRGEQALDLRVREVIRTVETVARRAREVGRAHDEAAELRLSRAAIDHDRVVQAVRAARLEELSAREARYASTLFDVFTTKEMLPLLRARPRGWRHLTTRCMREWERFAPLEDRSEYTHMWKEAPSDALRVQMGLDAATLLGENGIALAAQAFHRIGEGRPLVAALADAGFSWRWELTSRVVEKWFLNRRIDWNEILPSVLDTEELRWALLPPRSNENHSRVRSSLSVRANIVANLIEDGAGHVLRSSLFDKVTARLLMSDFGDPRIPPLSDGWLGVRERRPQAFATFVQSLVLSDLRFFFELVNGDADRLSFWEEYLPRLQGAFCVLDPATYDIVQAKLRMSDDERSASALARVKQARRGSVRVQAFCLFFQDIVVVEFSETGHAAYIYSRARFERDVLPAVEAGLTETTHLKKAHWPEDQRILHHAGWRKRARWKIATCERDGGRGVR